MDRPRMTSGISAQIYPASGMEPSPQAIMEISAQLAFL
jgi:hypothetical protein